MKKLLLVVGLVIFLTPMVVSAKNFIKPINLKKDLSTCVNMVNEFGVDCSAYIIKSDIACFTKAKLRSKKCYMDTFEIKSRDNTYRVGETDYSSILKNYGLYKIIESKNINDLEWVKVCPYGSNGILKDRYGNTHKDCGWTNEINEFHLASSLLPDNSNKTKVIKVDVLDNDLTNSKCIMDPNHNTLSYCFCKRPDGSYFKVRQSSATNVFDICQNERYGNIQVILKEALESGFKFNYNKSWVSADKQDFIYCKRLDLEGGSLSYISTFPISYKNCPEDSSSAQYIKVSVNEYKQSEKEHLTNALDWENKLNLWRLEESERQHRCYRDLNLGRTNSPDCKNGKIKNKKLASFDKFAIALGCGIKRKDIEDCIRRYLPSVVGSGPITLEQVEEIKGNRSLMGEIVHAIEEMNRQQNQSKNQEPSEEEKKQAQAQQNATGQATWKSTAGGIWYWDYGNGFGWAPPNPIRDKIIQGLMVGQRTKNMLKTGSRGRTIFIPR
ncbi:hypothetical protein OAJ30_02625 [Alphaproteobacteria bacterium]|nr:hypothetical protein [Alphaproteobacteria bacterium]